MIAASKGDNLCCVKFMGFPPAIHDLTAGDQDQIQLHERAAEASRAQFGRRGLVRGGVDLSNACRETCADDLEHHRAELPVPA